MFRPFYFVGFLFILFVLKSNNFSELFIEKDIEFVPSFVEKSYMSDLERLAHKIELLKQTLETEPKAERVRKEVESIRLAYKKVEFLTEYLDPYFCKYQMNGAPLPKTEPKVPEVVILEPSGLQVIDELAYADDLKIKELKKQIDKVGRALDRFIRVQKNILNLENRYILEASRNQIIRIFTLGLTGFDTPGSGNAIPESIISGTISPFGHHQI